MKKYILSGIVLPFNTRSSNHRIYTKDSISQDVLDEFKNRIDKGEVAGVLEQRASLVSMSTPVDQISHKVNNIEMTDEGLVAELEILDTPKGELIKQMIDSGVALYGSSRGLGFVDKDNICHLEQLVSIDLTGCTSFDPEYVNSLKVNGKPFEQFIEDKLKKLESEKSLNVMIDEDIKLYDKYKQKEQEGNPSNFTSEQLDEIYAIIEDKLGKFEDVIQDWVVEHYSPEVQKWVEEHFAPTLQEWLTEQFIPSLKIEVDKRKLKEE